MIEKLVPFCKISDRKEAKCPYNFPLKNDSICYKQCDNKFISNSVEKNKIIS